MVQHALQQYSGFFLLYPELFQLSHIYPKADQEPPSVNRQESALHHLKPGASEPLQEGVRFVLQNRLHILASQEGGNLGVSKQLKIVLAQNLLGRTLGDLFGEPLVDHLIAEAVVGILDEKR